MGEAELSILDKSTAPRGSAISQATLPHGQVTGGCVPSLLKSSPIPFTLPSHWATEANWGSGAEGLQPAWPPHLECRLNGSWKEIGPGKAVAQVGENVDAEGKALDVAGARIL